MSIENVWWIIALCAVLNTAAWVFTSIMLFGIYRLPFYHLMAIYQLYHLLGFVIRPWEMLLIGQSDTWTWIGVIPEPDSLLWASAVGVIAHLTIFAGFVMSKPKGSIIPTLPPINFRVKRPYVFAAIIIAFFALGAYSARTQMASWAAGGGGEIDSRGMIRTTDVSGYQTVFMELVTIALLTLFAVRRTRIIGICATLAYTVYRMNYGSGRSSFVALLLSIGMMALVNQRRRFPTPRVVALGLALFFIFNLVGSNRRAVGNIFAGEMTVSQFVGDYFDTSRENIQLTKNMQEWDVFTSVLTHVPSETGYSWGTQYIRLLIWPIPRFLWHDKPISTVNFDLLDYGNYFALTTTLYADSYETAGLLGMIVILFLISYHINWLYRSLLTRPSSLRYLVYFIYLAYSPLLFRDGPVSAAYFYLVLSAGAICLCRGGGLTISTYKDVAVSRLNHVVVAHA